MRHFFVCLVVSFVASGCSCAMSHELASLPDSGPMPIGDAGSMMVILDAGSDAFVPMEPDAATPDAGMDAATVIHITLAPDSPSGHAFAVNSSGVLLANFRMQWDDTPRPDLVSLFHVQIHHTASEPVTDFENLYLYNGVSGQRYSLGRTINPATGMIEFYDVEIPIISGGIDDFALRADLHGTDSFAGTIHTFEVVSADAVSFIGGDGLIRPVDVVGDFPVRSSDILFAPEVASRVEIIAGAVPPDPPLVSSDAVISNFIMRIGAHEVEFEQMVITDGGSLSAGGTAGRGVLYDLRLFAGTDLVATGGTWTTRYGQLVLQFVPGYRLPAGSETSFVLHAAVTSPESRTIRTYIEYPTDVRAVDTYLGDEAAVCISPTATGGCTDVGQGSFDGSGPGAYVEVTTR